MLTCQATPLVSIGVLDYKLPKTESEIARFKSEIDGIEHVYLEDIQNKVIFTDVEKRFSITGALSYVLGDYIAGKELQIIQGSSPQMGKGSNLPEIMIHQQLADNMRLGLEDLIQVNEQTYRIVGIYTVKEVSLYSSSFSNQERQVLAYVVGDIHFHDINFPESATLSIVPQAAYFDSVFEQLENRLQNKEFGYVVIKTKVPRSRLFPDQQLYELNVICIIYIGAIIIGAILMIVNIQMNRIRGITREVALMKALGVKDARVLAIISVQYGLLSLCGSLLGSIGLMLVIGNMPPELKPFMNETLILLTISLLFIVIFTIAIGVIPARYCLKTDVTLYRANRD